MRRMIAVMISGLMLVPTAALAQPDGLPEHAAEKVAEAQARAERAAEAFADEKARGQSEDKSTGLERAAEVSNSWRFTGADRPGNGGGNGNGRALGAGHAAQVHEALANGLSPSELPSHGDVVSAAAQEMRDAFEGMKAKSGDHPGQGRGVGGPGGDAADG